MKREPISVRFKLHSLFLSSAVLFLSHIVLYIVYIVFKHLEKDLKDTMDSQWVINLLIIRMRSGTVCQTGMKAEDSPWADLAILSLKTD